MIAGAVYSSTCTVNAVAFRQVAEPWSRAGSPGGGIVTNAAVLAAVHSCDGLAPGLRAPTTGWFSSICASFSTNIEWSFSPLFVDDRRNEAMRAALRGGPHRALRKIEFYS
jgi:hypothetical protein